VLKKQVPGPVVVNHPVRVIDPADFLSEMKLRSMGFRIELVFSWNRICLVNQRESFRRGAVHGYPCGSSSVCIDCIECVPVCAFCGSCQGDLSLPCGFPVNKEREICLRGILGIFNGKNEVLLLNGKFGFQRRNCTRFMDRFFSGLGHGRDYGGFGRKDEF
jgi:hypothetical protein